MTQRFLPSCQRTDIKLTKPVHIDSNKALSAAGVDDLQKRDMDERGLSGKDTVDDDFTKLDDDDKKKLEEEVKHDKEEAKTSG